jgi:hypothetical protein
MILLSGFRWLGTNIFFLKKKYHMVYFYIHGEENFQKVCQFLLKKQIILKADYPIIDIDEQYFMMVYKFLSKNKINHHCRNKAKVVSSLLRQKKFDDIS